MSNSKKSTEIQDELQYPGIANDIADGERCDKKLVEEEVKDLNNNPRNDDGPQPKE